VLILTLTYLEHQRSTNPLLSTAMHFPLSNSYAPLIALLLSLSRYQLFLKNRFDPQTYHHLLILGLLLLHLLISVTHPRNPSLNFWQTIVWTHYFLHEVSSSSSSSHHSSLSSFSIQLLLHHLHQGHLYLLLSQIQIVMMNLDHLILLL
jgi:hypothetical protein